ncbi:MAG: patatin-like phospholipase family protein [Gammaproteobacteria bacterium]|nr:patatin-like phospholipase family protein [Gammaproteobacteria bacterium]MBQ0840785.1 patatin-like phospholipase family protein [Gammaproteobacteria bacterium]
MESEPGSDFVPIFAGGGTRLSAHIGILQALETLGVKFDHLVGVSGGSIIGALYAAGFSLPDIKQLALETNFSQFKGYSFIQLLKAGGLSTGAGFEQWVESFLEGRRFKDLSRNLHIVATDVLTGSPVIFNKTLTPDLKVSKAVRYSMSIPLLFTFNQYDKHILVDGSILAEDALHRDWSGCGTPVICFRMRSVELSNKVKVNGRFPLKAYLTLLIRTFMNTISREYINDKFWDHTVVVNTGAISPIEFNLSDAEKELLFLQGYNTAMEVIPAKVFAAKSTAAKA